MSCGPRENVILRLFVIGMLWSGCVSWRALYILNLEMLVENRCSNGLCEHSFRCFDVVSKPRRTLETDISHLSLPHVVFLPTQLLRIPDHRTTDPFKG